MLFLGSINYFYSWSIFYICKKLYLLGFFSSFTLSAYFNVFKVFSLLAEFGDTLPIMTVRQYPVKESFKTMVNLLPLNGVWCLFWSNALIHYFKAKSDLLISAPSIRVCF